MLTRIVRTGLASTVSTPAIPAAWTMCVTPFAASVRPGRSSTSPCRKRKFGWSPRSVPESASRCRLSNAITSFASTSRRASVVPMKPAPPVIRILLPLSATRRVYRRLSWLDRCTHALLATTVVPLLAALGGGAARRPPARARSTSASPTARATRRPPKVLTLRCDPARGTVADPARACRRLRAIGPNALRADAARHGSARRSRAAR